MAAALDKAPGRRDLQRPGSFDQAACSGAVNSKVQKTKETQSWHIERLRSLVARLLASVFRTRYLPRHFHRHFHRHPVLQGVVQSGVSRDLPESVGAALLAASAGSPEAALAQLGSRASGLTPAQAAAIRRRVGSNEVERDRPMRWWAHLWHSYSNPFNLLLSALALVSWLTQDLKAAAMIGSMVVLATSLRYWQEARAAHSADALKAMVSTTARVCRPPVRAASVQGQNQDRPDPTVAPVQPADLVDIPLAQLVPGDVVKLSAGDMIPADCRVLGARDLFVSQSAMTGESAPVEKFAHPRPADLVNPLALDNLLFMGTHVLSGSAFALVVNTGRRTYFGALAGRLAQAEGPASALTLGLNQVSWLLIRMMLIMVPVLLLINGLTKGDWMASMLFAVSIAVGLAPEMLPMIVTSTLGRGAVFLSRKKVIVKRLDAIQTFGAMDVLCTDKTGTLTQDKIFLYRHVDAWGQESDQVLALAYLNSYYQTGLQNLLDVAVLQHVEMHSVLELATAYSKVDEIPFDFNRRRMSVVVAERDQRHLLITKGALDEILTVCNRVREGQGDEPLTPERLTRIRSLTSSYNDAGLRVVAVASKVLPPTQSVYSVADERDLVLSGYVAFLDPPKDSTTPALKALQELGVQVKVLSGDNDRVTAKICREVGLPEHGLLTGAEVARLSDAELAPVLEKANVFARLTPLDKERIVRLLKANGHVVGFMGDGINDAPALRMADIGISVDTAVDIAREAADIILLEKSLMVLQEGVREGRRTFANMLKYLLMTTSSNFGNVLSMLVASLFLPFLPMLPVQLLLQNLVYDVSQTAIAFDHVDEDLLRQPLRWQAGDIGHFMLFFGPISSVFDLTTFAMMWFVFKADTPQQQGLFQSGWFVVGLLTQTLVVHMVRTPRLPFIQSRAAAPLVVMTVAVMALGIFLPMGPLAPYFGLQHLPAQYFLFLPLILLGYMALTQAMKGIYRRRWGWP
jgi:Mg2+-importing ATPase